MTLRDQIIRLTWTSCLTGWWLAVALACAVMSRPWPLVVSSVGFVVLCASSALATAAALIRAFRDRAP